MSVKGPRLHSIRRGEFRPGQSNSTFRSEPRGQNSDVLSTHRDRSLDVSDLSEYHAMLSPEVRARLEGK